MAGSPITSIGTFTVTLVNQSANRVFAGPASAPDAAPTFRTLAIADIPALPYAPTASPTFTGLVSTDRVSVQPAGTDVAISATGDGHGNDIQDWFAFGGALVANVQSDGTIFASNAVFNSIQINNALLDGSGLPGSPGQVLSSTNTSTAWITLPSDTDSFSGLTTGANTTATMTVGSGASIVTSGSGTVTATAVPFSGVSSSANSTATMTVNTGASIVVTGTGVVEATQVQAVVVSATPPSIGQVLTATSPTAADWQTPAGGGVPSGTPVYQMGSTPPRVWGPGYAGSRMMKLAGRSLTSLPASWKVRMMVGSGAHFGAVSVLTTLADDLNVISATAVTFGGSASPTLSGLSTSDAIALPLDTIHDYWIIAYNDGSGDTSLWALSQPASPDNYSGTALLVGGLLGGDQTAVNPVNAGGMSAGYGCPFDAILAA